MNKATKRQISERIEEIRRELDLIATQLNQIGQRQPKPKPQRRSILPKGF